MRTSHTIATALMAAGLAALPMAAQSQAQPQKPAATRPGMVSGQIMGTGAMAEQMKKAQAQMERIRKSTDPKEREKLLAEHLSSMQAVMRDMGGMGGGMMGGGVGGAAGGAMMGGAATKGESRAPSTDQRMQMMENRLDMMQMMMDQMLQREQMMSLPAK